MKIEATDGLAGLHAALEAPEGERDRVYAERVMMPMRPVFEPMLRMNPAVDPATAFDDPIGLAQSWGYYVPGDAVEEGLAALAKLESVNTFERCLEALRRAEAALKPEEHGVDLPLVRMGVLLMAKRMVPENDKMQGYTGLGGMPGTVVAMTWPTDFSMPRMPSSTAHEFNHNVRFSFEPWTMNTTVGQYIVAEGLAENFAAEQYSHDLIGPWLKLFSESDLQELRPRFRESLNVSGFDEIRGYIFGDWAAEQFGYKAQGLPDFAGYAMGYRVVRAYLERTGRTAAEATYLPWQEIAEESGYL
jgi:uncharacterized protein YjaZ